MLKCNNCLYVGYENINEDTGDLITTNGGINTYPNLLIKLMNKRGLSRDRFKLRNIKNIPENMSYIYPLTIFECNGSPHKEGKELRIPENVLKDVRNKRCVILIDFTSEGLENGYLKELETFMIKLCDKYDINHTSMFYMDGNHQVNRNISFECIPFTVWDTCNMGLSDEYIDSLIVNIKNKVEKFFKISCFNRRAKYSRFYLAYNLFDICKNNDVIFTLSKSFIKYVDYHDSYRSVDEIKYNEFIESMPWEYDTNNLHNHKEGINKSIHNNAYIHINTESLFEGSIFFSEKTFKPIIMLQPFITVSSPGSLSTLKSFGYETFPELFDESYDEIENGQNRLAHIVKEIRKVYSYSNQELSNKVYEVLPKLVHNAKLHKSITSNSEILYTLLKKEIYKDN